jgi:hypothetical protein
MVDSDDMMAAHRADFHPGFINFGVPRGAPLKKS